MTYTYKIISDYCSKCGTLLISPDIYCINCGNTF